MLWSPPQTIEPKSRSVLILSNTEGKPNPDRTWTECFAQLVGTVLSLWDAAELDAAGDDGEVLPKFLNLTDASIKMVRHTHTHPLASFTAYFVVRRMLNIPVDRVIADQDKR